MKTLLVYGFLLGKLIVFSRLFIWKNQSITRFLYQNMYNLYPMGWTDCSLGFFLIGRVLLLIYISIVKLFIDVNYVNKKLSILT